MAETAQPKSPQLGAMFGEPFKSMAKNTGALVVFALK